MIVLFTFIILSKIMESYSCTVCNYECDSVGRYISHHKLHKNVANLIVECPISTCRHRLTSCSSLKAHIHRVHFENRRSDSLPVPASLKPAVLARTFEHGDGVSEICLKCLKLECSAFSFDTFAQLKFHLKQHLCKKEEILCPFQRCPKTFTVLSSFTAHVSRKHNEMDIRSLSACYYIDHNSSIDSNQALVASRSQNSIQDQAVEDTFHQSDIASDISDNAVLDIPYEFDLENNNETENHFLNNLALFYLKLQGKYLLPVSTIQIIIEQFEECHEMSQSLLTSKVCATLALHDVGQEVVDIVKKEMTENDLFLHCNTGPLKTAAKRASFFRKHLPYCEPVEVFLGYDSMRKKKTYQYVPICQSIAKLYQHFPSHFKWLGPQEIGTVDCLNDVTDGLVFKEKRFLHQQNSVAIILYQDAFEVVNPLGSAKKKHKLIGVYYTLANFASEKRSNIDHLQLVLLCRETDLKTFSSNKVFARLILDLKILETEGVSVGSEIIKGTLLCITGDNLGSHTVGGYQESFSANYFCRYCELNRQECQSIDEMGNLRSVDTYKSCVELLNKADTCNTVKGIKSESPFNALNFYHVASPGLPPCLGHDLFAGIVAYDMALIIKYFVDRKWFSCEQLNHRISVWPYQDSDLLDKPAPFTLPGEKLAGQAIQNWVFLRLFPFFVGNFIKDAENPVWQMYLNLKKIVDILCSHRILLAHIAYVNVCIQEYIYDRKTLFPDRPLRPKHHFLLHYPKLVLDFGPLIHLWTMRFESKHSYFKRCARQLKNFKHLAKTLAQRHQQLQAYYAAGSLFKESLLVTGSAMPVCCNLYNETIRNILAAQCMTKHNTVVSGKCTYKNVHYKIGNCLIMSNLDCDDHVVSASVVIGKVQMLLLKDDMLSFIVAVSHFSHVPNLGLFRQDVVGENGQDYQWISVSDLKCSIPVSVYEFKNSLFCSIKSVHN